MKCDNTWIRSGGALLLAALVLAGCATAPTGPSVRVFPGTGKTFDQFRMDEDDCRNYAFNRSDGSTNTAARDMGIATAATAAVVGALAGVAVNGKRGAGVGAAVGAVGGGLIGAERGDATVDNMQVRYDNAYVQCMYAKGHLVPGVSGMQSRQAMPQDSGSAAAIPPPPSR